MNTKLVVKKEVPNVSTSKLNEAERMVANEGITQGFEALCYQWSGNLAEALGLKTYALGNPDTIHRSVDVRGYCPRNEVTFGFAFITSDIGPGEALTQTPNLEGRRVAQLDGPDLVVTKAETVVREVVSRCNHRNGEEVRSDFMAVTELFLTCKITPPTIPCIDSWRPYVGPMAPPTTMPLLTAILPQQETAPGQH